MGNRSRVTIPRYWNLCSACLSFKIQFIFVLLFTFCKANNKLRCHYLGLLHYLIFIFIFCFIFSSPTTPIIDSGISDALPDPPPSTNLDTNTESNHESVSSHSDMVTDDTLSDSRALVAVPPINAEALAMVPLNPKSKRSELVQRRTRRPFSVSEVEALVHAVEEVGTGRYAILFAAPLINV